MNCVELALADSEALPLLLGGEALSEASVSAADIDADALVETEIEPLEDRLLPDVRLASAEAEALRLSD
jgi:hypothetical protein